MTELGVNVDHIATVREARKIEIPDPVEAALLAEQNGADGITIHLRKDRRHIQERDLRLLKKTVKTRLNLEMAVTSEMKELALDVFPEQVTLVPEEREEVTTEGGLDVISNTDSIERIVDALKERDILASLFIDPEPEQINCAQKVNADAIELHTGEYSETFSSSQQNNPELERLHEAAGHADEIGLRVFAGHGLNYRNVQSVAGIEPVEELNIGHSMIAKAVMVGIGEATRKMKEQIEAVS